MNIKTIVIEGIDQDISIRRTERGAEATIEQQATDVATFLEWAGDPHMEERKRTGIVVLAFLLALTALLYLAYKQVWRNESH